MENRTIKFRGKRVDNGEWVYGYFVANVKGHCYILTITDSVATYPPPESPLVFSGIHARVLPETVGQQTGLKDRDGKMIFEGDVVSHRYMFGNGKGVVSYWPPTWKLFDGDGTCDEIDLEDCEIIGDIHQNPELMEQK